MEDQPDERPLLTHSTIPTWYTRKQIAMPGVGFELNILLHASNSAATVIGLASILEYTFS
jgi:hypothetical protein